MPGFVGNLLCNGIPGVQIHGADANVERSRLALVDDRVDQASGLEERLYLRDLPTQQPAHPGHVHVASDRMILLQAHLNEGVIHGCVGGVDRGQIGIDANVRDNHVEVGGRHHLANDVFNARRSIGRSIPNACQGAP